jgi:hypothetical protein
MPDPPFLHMIATSIVVFVLILHYLFISSREEIKAHCASWLSPHHYTRSVFLQSASSVIQRSGNHTVEDLG